MKIILEIDTDDYKNVQNPTDDKFKQMINYAYSKLYTNEDDESIKNVDLICQRLKNDINDNIKGVQNNLNSMDLEKKLGDVSFLLEQLFGIANNSNKKGELSENIIAEIITNEYTNSCYEVTRSTPHMADGKLITPSGMEALIEVKNYNKSVIEEEVNKFKYDLQYNRIKYGLFVSLQTSVVRRNNFSIETFKYNDEEYYIVFVSKIISNQNLIFAGLLLLEQIYQNEKNHSNEKSNDDYSVMKDIICKHFTNMSKITERLTTIRDNFYQMEKTIKSSLDTYYHEYRSFESEIKGEIELIWKELMQDLDVEHSKLIQLNTIEEFIATLEQQNDKCAIIYQRLYDQLKLLNIQLELDNTDVKLSTDMDHIGTFKKYKTKIVYQHVSPDVQVTLKCNDIDLDTNIAFVYKLL